MNRFVSLLPVALALAAIGLAQPAHAQWTRTSYYLDPNNKPSTDANTTCTTTPTGVTLTSTPTSGYYGTSAAGNYNGYLDVVYTWTGDPNSPYLGGLNASNSYAVSGSSRTTSGSASSQAGSDVYHGALRGQSSGSPDQTYSGSGSGVSTFVLYNNTSTVVKEQYTLSAATAASYTGSATASATVTPGSPSP